MVFVSSNLEGDEHYTHKINLFVPSCNTDQGVYHGCEYVGVKPKCVMKVNRVIIERCATCADLDSVKKDSSNSIYGGTRKMVNYA